METDSGVIYGISSQPPVAASLDWLSLNLQYDLREYYEEHCVMARLAKTGGTIVVIQHAIESALGLLNIHDGPGKCLWYQQFEKERLERVEHYKTLLGDEGASLVMTSNNSKFTVDGKGMRSGKGVLSGLGLVRTGERCPPSVWGSDDDSFGAIDEIDEAPSIAKDVLLLGLTILQFSGICRQEFRASESSMASADGIPLQEREVQLLERMLAEEPAERIGIDPYSAHDRTCRSL
ncbi:unnamed protein product [Phytophthora lilii]|uniref:Unnamed protein product n=1 Tax=Phytophthora lilii TaxID=2077276 RepID=A0A9W6WWI6_9STRA|nr:unnamed protein product [Phytophthora lilii]